jgi:hypothetical protein
MKHFKHASETLAKTREKHLNTIATHTQHADKNTCNIYVKHMQYPDKHTCNIRLKKKQMKHWEQICVILIIHMKHLHIPLKYPKHTFATYVFRATGGRDELM